ncbi:MAG: metal ABC transporter ATP-binding protein [Candidatus Hodarchaeales archaeon]
MDKFEEKQQDENNSKFSVEYSNVSLRYRGNLISAVENVTFQSIIGNIIGILGPNGAGKTTLYKGILGLIKPYKGNIRVFGNAPSNQQRQMIGYVPQINTVNADMPILARDVIMMGRWPQTRFSWRSRETDNIKVNEIITALNLEDIQKRPFGSLSGGQKQRTLVARALAQSPRLLLLDEPLTGVDAKGCKQISQLLENIRKEKQITIFVIEQDINPHIRYDQVLLLNRKIIAAGAPVDVFNSDNIQQFGAQNDFFSLIAPKLEE